jgi:hypothetical protein
VKKQLKISGDCLFNYLRLKAKNEEASRRRRKQKEMTKATVMASVHSIPRLV